MRHSRLIALSFLSQNRGLPLLSKLQQAPQRFLAQPTAGGKPEGNRCLQVNGVRISLREATNDINTLTPLVVETTTLTKKFCRLNWRDAT